MSYQLWYFKNSSIWIIEMKYAFDSSMPITRTKSLDSLKHCFYRTKKTATAIKNCRILQKMYRLFEGSGDKLKKSIREVLKKFLSCFESSAKTKKGSKFEKNASQFEEKTAKLEKAFEKLKNSSNTRKSDGTCQKSEKLL